MDRYKIKSFVKINDRRLAAIKKKKKGGRPFFVNTSRISILYRVRFKDTHSSQYKCGLNQIQNVSVAWIFFFPVGLIGLLPWAVHDKRCVRVEYFLVYIPCGCFLTRSARLVSDTMHNHHISEQHLQMQKLERYYVISFQPKHYQLERGACHSMPIVEPAICLQIR